MEFRKEVTDFTDPTDFRDFGDFREGGSYRGKWNYLSNWRDWSYRKRTGEADLPRDGGWGGEVGDGGNRYMERGSNGEEGNKMYNSDNSYNSYRLANSYNKGYSGGGLGLEG